MLICGILIDTVERSIDGSWKSLMPLLYCRKYASQLPKVVLSVALYIVWLVFSILKVGNTIEAIVDAIQNI